MTLWPCRRPWNTIAGSKCCFGVLPESHFVMAQIHVARLMCEFCSFAERYTTTRFAEPAAAFAVTTRHRQLSIDRHYMRRIEQRNLPVVGKSRVSVHTLSPSTPLGTNLLVALLHGRRFYDLILLDPRSETARHLETSRTLDGIRTHMQSLQWPVV